MATTTNFGWETPDDTDLVKDGAAAIRTLGGAIDTSLVDLKGGTTGQILSKASNTDMDFTWVASNPGDITEVTAGTGLTGGGTSGAVSLAFDVANYGGGQWAAGKNKIINGDFRVNQRNFSSTTSTGTFTFDRWQTAVAGGTSTISSQTFTPGTAPVSGYEGKTYLRLVSTGQSAASDRTSIFQYIEDSRTLAGQTATVSFWAKASTGTPSVAIEFWRSYGTGGTPSGAEFVVSAKSAITSSWARYSFTVSIASLSGKTLGTTDQGYLAFGIYTSAGSNFNTNTQTLGIQSATIDIWGVQIEAGSTATPFQTATGTIQGEINACERYFQIMTGAMCSGSNSTTVYSGLNFRTQMRTAPTVALSAAMVITDAGADYTQSSANISIQSSRANSTGAQIVMANFSSITTHRPYSTTITGSQIQLSAEL